MKYSFIFALSAFALLISLSPLRGETSLEAPELFNRYDTLYQQTLKRLVEVENRADGLSAEFRDLLGDRKNPYPTSFKGPGKILNDPMLLYFTITERKRLEKEGALIQELKKNPLLLNQYRKRLASNILALELSSVIITFIEYLDEFHRGERKLSNQQAERDWETMTILSGTLTAFKYSKTYKAGLLISNPLITQLDPQGAKEVRAFFETTLGRFDEDSVLPVSLQGSPKQRSQQELERFKKTRQLVTNLTKMASTIVATNKSLLDEYQYRILVLNQKLKEKRIISSERKP